MYDHFLPALDQAKKNWRPHIIFFKKIIGVRLNALPQIIITSILALRPLRVRARPPRGGLRRRAHAQRGGPPPPPERGAPLGVRAGDTGGHKGEEQEARQVNQFRIYCNFACTFITAGKKLDHNKSQYYFHS